MEETFILIVLMMTSSLTTCCTWHEISACPHRDRDTSLEVVCKTNNVLANIQVMSRHHSGNCTGSSPNLLAAVNNCYWKQNCSLPYSYNLNKMVTTCGQQSLGGDEDQLEKVNTLLVGENLCIHKKKVINICDTKKARLNGNRPGVIRSHDLYPWYYDDSPPQNRSCTKRIDLNLQRHKTTLVVGTRAHQLCENDDLGLQLYGEREYKRINSSIPEVPHIFNKSDIYVDVSFRSASKGRCNGFIVCYKALTEKQYRRFKHRHIHVCDLVANRLAKVSVVVGDTYNIDCESCKKEKCKRCRRHMDAWKTTKCCCSDSQCMAINAAQLGGK